MINLSQFNTITNKHQAVLANSSGHLEPIRQSQAKVQRSMQPINDLANRVSTIQDGALSAYPFEPPLFP